MSEQLPNGFSLNQAQRSTLHALVTTILPHLLEAGSDVPGLVTLVEDRIRAAPPHVTKDLATALSVVGSRVGGLLVTGRPFRFADNAPGVQKEAFDTWSTSVFPMARSVHQALRRLILTTWYTTDAAHFELGVRPPLHTRAPEFPWEGPLAGDRSLDEEPIARESRMGIGESIAHPRPRLAMASPAEFTGELSLTADVVIIGSGAGGAVAAARFAEAGREIVILEEGVYLHDEDFTENEGEMVPRLFAEQAMRTTSDASVSLLQGGAVGGGTTVNWMLMLRPLDHVLEEWMMGLGLPGFSAGELAPHLDRVGRDVHARLVPAEAHSPANRAIVDGAAALGWRARAAMINAKGCVRAGTCSLGCRFGAKQDARLIWLPRALAAGGRLYAGASVQRIEVIERGNRAMGISPPRKRVRATMRDPRSGRINGTLTVEAPVVVLAAGAVGTPVILQQSGLGGGGVGKYLRLHPTTAVMGHYDHETYPLVGIPQSVLCDEFIQNDRNGYGFWIESPALLPALASAALPGFGTAHRALMKELTRTNGFIVLVRDGSGTDESMGSVILERNGRVRIRHQLSAADRDNLRHGIEAAARLHLAAGARDAVSLHTPPMTATDDRGLRAMRAASVAPNRVGLFSAHVNGTCRLGVNPSTSGCSPTGERHGVRGLYVMDGSLLPTAPGVNPQWTIMAMASLLAERATH